MCSPVLQLRCSLFLLLAITSVGPVWAKEVEQVGDWTLTIEGAIQVDTRTVGRKTT